MNMAEECRYFLILAKQPASFGPRKRIQGQGTAAEDAHVLKLMARVRDLEEEIGRLRRHHQLVQPQIKGANSC
jgi:hypothetical protein